MNKELRDALNILRQPTPETKMTHGFQKPSTEVTITRDRYEAYQACETKLKDLIEAAEVAADALDSAELGAAIEKARK